MVVLGTLLVMVSTVFSKTQGRSWKSTFLVKNYRNVALNHLELLRDKWKNIFASDNAGPKWYKFQKWDRLYNLKILLIISTATCTSISFPIPWRVSNTFFIDSLRYIFKLNLFWVPSKFFLASCCFSRKSEKNKHHSCIWNEPSRQITS